MVDICMCQNEDCPLKDSCYRYRAKASEYQTFYIVGDKMKKDAQERKCTSYWEVKSDEEVEKLNRYWAD